MPVDPFEQLNTLFTDIADAIREKMSSKYDFTDMSVFNQICKDVTGFTVNQSVFNELKNNIFTHPEWYPNYYLFGTKIVGSNSIALYLFAPSDADRIVNLSDIVIEQLSDRVRVHNNSDNGLQYGRAGGTEPIISTKSNIGAPPYILSPHGFADLQNEVLLGNLFTDIIGSISAQKFSTLIRNLNV